MENVENPLIASLKDRLAHNILADSYELYKLVVSGEKNVKSEWVSEARKFLELIEHKIGKAK